MKSQFMPALFVRLRSHWARRQSVIFGSGLLLLAVVMLWQLPGRFGLAAEMAWRNPNVPSATHTGSLPMTGDVSGTVFEDVNYGGGAGRSLTASSGAPVANSRVELYDSAGNFVMFTTTNASGQYAFPNFGAGNYTVRVVNGSVRSTRAGGAACSTCPPVQTFRTNASTGAAIPVTDHVGGEVPNKVDAGNGSTTLAALTTATTTPQSIAAVTVGAGNVGGVDFGFNFDTIVNVNDAGQGSYPQFTINAKELGGEALLAQAGMRMNICILPSHPTITPEALPPGKETTIFMIANGQARPGLNTGYANLLDANGVATILLTAFATVRGDHTNLDGTTQTFNVGDTNGAVLGTGGLVGGENNMPLPRLNGPEVQLLVTNPAVNYVIGVVGNHVTVRGLGVQGAGGGWDIYYVDFNGSNNDFALVEQNVLGASAADFMHIGTERNLENLHLTGGSTGAIVRCNLMKDAGDMNLHMSQVNGVLVEGNEFNRTVGYVGTINFPVGGPGIRADGSSVNTIRGNLFTGAQRGGIQLVVGAGGTGCTNNIIEDNTFTENLVGGVVVTSGASQTPAVISQLNKISRNSFYNNTGLAIDLNPLPLVNLYAPPEFVTSNNGTLTQLLPNQDLDYPIINSATLAANTLTVQGFVGSAPGVGPFGNVTVEFYVADNVPLDQNGEIIIGDGQSIPHGEGRYYIGSCLTGSGASSGIFNCNLTVPNGVTITSGTTEITATSTYVLDTSEFGPNKLVECPPIALTPTSLPNGFTGMFYTQTIQANPSGSTYNYAVTSGMPPTGLTLNAATGVLDGTPLEPGYYSFTVTATLTGTTCSVQQPYTIFINCPGATITVTTAADTVALDGKCSLREAIMAANGNAPFNECPAGVQSPNSDFIYFYIGTGTPAINVLSALPTVMERAVIDGSKCQSTRVELNGTGAGAGVNGLELTASNSAILSMVINRFSLDGLVIANSSNNVVENCLIGTDATGVLARPNRDGILLNNATNNRIGGSLAGQRNLISGNNRSGLLLNQANGNQVLGNLVGTDISGLLDVGNGVSGLVLNFSDNCAVGGAATGAGNVFSGNNAHGVVVQFSSNTLVQGNKVGTAENGTAAVGNGLDGVAIVATSQNNRIGGNQNEANVIAFNGRNGVTVNNNFGPAFNNAILTNSIHSNAQLGIDLAPNEPLTLGVTLNDAGDGDDGPNRFQNFPVLLNVTANQIQGTLDSAPGTYTLQFFNNTACDPSQHGEGQTFIGEMQFTVTGSGPQLFSFIPPQTLTAHDFITSTATNALGNTSEFSECHQCEICPTITFTPATLPNGSVGVAYNQTITASGGTPPHTFILSSGTTAPPGLTLSSAGVLSGTPTQGGSFTFLVKAFAKDGCFGLQQYTVTIGCTSFTLMPAALPNGETGTLYSQTIGTNPVGAAANFTVTGGLAPPGLALDAATGLLSGLPTTPGYYTFTVTAGSGACTASQNYVVFINCHGATITVTTAADTVAVDGGCSLREAMQAANGNAAVNECPAGNGVGDGLDRIYFYIGTGTPTINVLSQLPTVTQRAVIDGSQCQAIRVELNCGGFTEGLRLSASNSLVRGMVINRSGIGVTILNGTGSAIENCYLGTDSSGTIARSNMHGVVIYSSGNRVGGVTPAERNVISGNQQIGIWLVEANANGNLVQGNYIGTTANGLNPLGNSQVGIYVYDSSDNTIGGGAPGAGNTIAYNGIWGVQIITQLDPALRNRVLGNSIHSNTGLTPPFNGLGIELSSGNSFGVTSNDPGDSDTGANNLQNFPVLTQAIPLSITGTLNSIPNSAPDAFTIQFFANPACDASGHGEGKTYLGQTTATTDANGNASFSFTPATPLTVGEVVTATATDGDGNTSEFSACRAVADCLPITVNPPTLNNGTAGVAYSQMLTASGGMAPYSFALRVGTLPGGLTLNATSGVISGTPTSFGVFNFTVEATDAGSCLGTRAYTLTITCPSGLVTVNPAAISNGFVGTAYNQTFTATGGTGPYSFTRVTGTLPTGLSLATTGALTGTPTTAGSFNFTVQAADANGCLGERSYTVIVSGTGLMFHVLDSPVRALETRIGGLPLTGCVRPDAPIAAGTTFTLAMRTGCTGIPANATAVTGNITVVPTFSAGGYLTLFPSNAAQPVVANSNFQPNEVTNNVFTVGLGPADGAFNIFASATTHVIVDVTGYFAPPSPAGLYFHSLPEPVRLVETRTLPDLPGCIKPGVPFPVGSTEVQGRSPVASPCNVIPATAQVLVGNATTIFPPAGGFLTIYSSDAVLPTVASSNYAGGDVINGPFAVKLGADGKFKVFTDVATDLVIDILGYYSTDAVDANGAGLLFTILPKPVRELETRPDFPGFPLTGCFRTNAPIQGGAVGIRTQPAWGVCDGLTIPNTARAILGNVTVVNPAAAGYLTFYPGNVATPPTVATSNYPFPVIFGYNRHFFVGLSPTDGTFKILTSATTDLIVDVSGYFAP